MERKSGRTAWIVGLLACALVCTLAIAGGATAAEAENVTPAENLVEIEVANRAAVHAIMADAEGVGAEFNDHYLRANRYGGTYTVQVLGSDEQIAALRDQGYLVTRTIEDDATYWERIGERLRAIEAERKA